MSTLIRNVPDLSKLEALDGSNYKRWSLRMLIFFEHLEIDDVLFSDPPAETGGLPASSSKASMDLRERNVCTDSPSGIEA